MHGDDSEQIEKSLPIGMAQLVDILGETVSAALISSFKVSPRTRLEVLRTNRYSHWQMVTKSFMSIGSGTSKDDPQIETIPKVDIEVKVYDPKAENKK